MSGNNEYDYNFDSRTYAPPVSRDCFFYAGPRGLYVKVEEKHEHYRADARRLYSLLTYTDPGPVYTKKGTLAKRQPAPHKDETGHFYIAQLMHYGLPIVKSKQVAKDRLLGAFVSGDGSSKELKVPQKILAIENELREEFDKLNAIERKKYYEERKREKQEEMERKARELERQQAAMEEFITGDTNKPTSRKKRKAERSSGDGPAGKKSRVKLDAQDLSGKYDISCPEIMREFDGGPYTFKLSPSAKTGKHLWISFNFGFVEGIMRSTGPPPKSTGETIHFLWRGHETGEGEMTYNKHSNTCAITFLGDGKFKGVFRSGYLDEKGAMFVGKKVPTPNIIWSRSVRDWKGTWRGINDASYEHARVARWGKWVSDEGCEGRPDDSDTTDAPNVSEGEDDDEGFYSFAL